MQFVMGRYGLTITFCAFFGIKKLILCVCLHLQTVPARSPIQISPALPTPPTDPSLSTGGATAPLQGHGQLSATKYHSDTNKPNV